MSCDCKCKYDSKTFISNQKQNSETCQCEYKNYCTCKRDLVGILAHVFVKMVSYWKSVAGDSKIVCDEIIYAMDIVSTNVTNITAANVASTMLTNSDGET